MPDVQIKLSALWVALLLTYLLGTPCASGAETLPQASSAASKRR